MTLDDCFNVFRLSIQYGAILGGIVSLVGFTVSGIFTYFKSL